MSEKIKTGTSGGNKENDDRHKKANLIVLVLQAWDHRSGGKHGYWMKQGNILFLVLLDLPDFDAMKI